MEIASNTHSVTVGDNYNNVYLVTGERSAFIDSGHDVDAEVDSLLDLWRSVGAPEVAAIVLTHRHADHSGGAKKLAEATGSVVMSSPIEKTPIEHAVPGTYVGRTLADGEVLDLGGAKLEFVHTPGHTVGSLSVHHREPGVLLAGDTIRTTEPFKMDPDAGDMELHLESLRGLLSYDFKLIGPGHGPLVEEPRSFIQNELATLGSGQ